MLCLLNIDWWDGNSRYNSKSIYIRYLIKLPNKRQFKVKEEYLETKTRDLLIHNILPYNDFYKSDSLALWDIAGRFINQEV